MTEPKLKFTKRQQRIDQDECQDKACSDAQNDYKNWMRTKGKKEPECPVDRETLGRNTWSLLHTIAAKYPSRPSREEKKDMLEFIRLIAILYPCSYCAEEFRKDITKIPPKLDSRKELTSWFCHMHNLVNVKLNKPVFDCSKVDERWRTGWKDGSCLP